MFVGGSYQDMSYNAKEGREVSEAMVNLKKRYPNYRFMMLSTPPPELVKKIKEAKIFVGYIPRDQLIREIYPRTSLIFLPSMMDIVGYSGVEAMFFGVVPIVSDHFAMPEIVGDAGVILRTPAKLWENNGEPNLEFQSKLMQGPFQELTDSIEDAAHILLSDDSKYYKLSEKSYNRMRNPPFAIDYRNKLLREVYDEACA